MEYILLRRSTFFSSLLVQWALSDAGLDPVKDVTCKLFPPPQLEAAVEKGVTLMSARPGVITEIVEVPLPEERWTVRRDSPQLLEVARYVSNHIADEVRKAQVAEQEVGF